MAKSKAQKAFRVQPRFRILCGEEIALGPGKALLLEKIDETGSISQAAKSIDMSYMRAWTLLKTMERCFNEPLILPLRGGSKGGGAQLTAKGKEILKLYREMEAQSLIATQDLQSAFAKFLKS